MKKYINFNYKIDSPYQQRAANIKAAGFDGVFIYSQYQPREYVKIIQDTGLKIETLHLPYKKFENGTLVDSRHVNVLWQNNIIGDQYVEDLINEIDFAYQNKIDTLIMHITGGDTPPPISGIGLQRIAKIVKYCESLNLTLCLENLRRLEYLTYIFSQIESENLKFCFDSGHANVMTHNVDTFPWDVFGNRLHCLHLNDNLGDHDKHLIPFNGNIDWSKVMEIIYSYNPNINLTLEVRATQEQRCISNETLYLENCYKSLCVLEKI
ncbi:MAG: sugar phosphate isomerase/epimerase [Clostridiales bacterium]|nr:sugar phosphate isomerase/epimerase [Clostridiales bacterium]